MRMQWDIVIIGAGPAGMSAALEAAKYTQRILVLDRQEQPGGQIFRHAGTAGQIQKSALGAEYTNGAQLVAQFKAAPVTYMSGASVWHVLPGRVYFSHEGESHCVLAEQVLIAGGGMERPVPLPGWTLPGVMGAGAADVLVKSAGLVPEGPVVLCGNGPLILQTVAHLKHFGVPIAGVVLTTAAGNILQAATRLPAALLRPAYLARGMGLGMKMVLGAPWYLGAKNVAVTLQNGRKLVTFDVRGQRRSLEAATVLLHEGVVSETRITRLARLRHIWNSRQRYWHVEADMWGMTSMPGIRCAGDVAGVRGADAAIAQGKLAGLDMCRELGLLLLAERDTVAGKAKCDYCRFIRFQPFIDTVFQPSTEALQPQDETIVCRCEELTAKDLREAIKAGSYSPDGLKSQARPGMGTCQGRMCSAAVAEMIAQEQGIPIEQLAQYHAQPPLVPLSLRELASLKNPPEGL